MFKFVQVLAFLVLSSSGASASVNPELLVKFKNLYTPIYIAAGLDLQVVTLPIGYESIIRAYWIKPESNRALIEVSTGFLEHPIINDDMATIALCHEAGHQLAGKLHYEPQADYYATLKCTRIMFRGDDNEKIIEEIKPSLAAQNLCMNAWKERGEQLVCMRSLVAGEEMILKYITPTARRFGYAGPDPSLSGRDRTQIAMTMAAYPNPQCRLDTYIAGATCNRSADAPPSNTDEFENICDVKNGDRVGNRPRCWYSPNG